MTTATRKVHAKNGVWVTDGGVEYPAVIVAALAALVEAGPGRSSLDARLFPRLRGSAWAAASIGAGAAGSLLNERFLVEPAEPAQPVQPARTDASEPAPVNSERESILVGFGVEGG
jgi:putative oxidoreductase